MGEDFILSTEGLTKEFAGFVAVKDVNLKSPAPQHTRSDRPQRRRKDDVFQSVNQVLKSQPGPHHL